MKNEIAQNATIDGRTTSKKLKFAKKKQAKTKREREGGLAQDISKSTSRANRSQ